MRNQMSRPDKHNEVANLREYGKKLESKEALPQRTFAVEMQHKYSVGDKVRVNNHQYIGGWHGEIAALMPYTFIAPAYYVNINGMTNAVSERNIERIEVKQV